MLLPPTPNELAELAEKARAFNWSYQPAPQSRPTATRLRRRLSPETVKDLKRRYQAGEHTTALSKEYGISKSGLVSLLRSEGVVSLGDGHYQTPLRNMPFGFLDRDRCG